MTASSSGRSGWWTRRAVVMESARLVSAYSVGQIHGSERFVAPIVPSLLVDVPMLQARGMRGRKT